MGALTDYQAEFIEIWKDNAHGCLNNFVQMGIEVSGKGEVEVKQAVAKVIKANTADLFKTCEKDSSELNVALLELYSDMLFICKNW